MSSGKWACIYSVWIPSWKFWYFSETILVFMVWCLVLIPRCVPNVPNVYVVWLVMKYYEIGEEGVVMVPVFTFCEGGQLDIYFI